MPEAEPEALCRLDEDGIVDLVEVPLVEEEAVNAGKPPGQLHAI